MNNCPIFLGRNCCKKVDFQFVNKCPEMLQFISEGPIFVCITCIYFLFSFTISWLLFIYLFLFINLLFIDVNSEVLRRNLKAGTEDTKASAYFCMVRANLEFCCSVWSPQYKNEVKKVEMVQSRAARFVTSRYRNTSKVSSMIDHLQWESLKSRRSKIQLNLLYKVVEDLVDIPADKYLTPSTARTRSAHSRKFRQYSTSTDPFKFSFFPHTIPLWNSLPASVAEAPSLASFRKELSTLSF